MENNILIAKFMGAQVTDLIGLQQPIYYPVMGKSVYSNKLKYHSDWNWLMEVVDKCSLKADELNADSLFRAELYMFVTNDITAVYNSCIDFIKWHNLQTMVQDSIDVESWSK